MSEALPSSGSFYVAGGTLRPGTPSYIVRQADSELYEHLLAGDFCYVLTARQMGKSSLMARTAKRLEEEGVRAAIVDLTQIGTERGATEANQWYFGVAHEIHRRLGIGEPLRPWWQERADLPALQRLTEFFRELVLAHCRGNVVIFVDEIDSTIGLPFADDFFAAIRACYNARATDREFERVTFVLLGVASPDQLIQDSTRTPFNIGHRVDLNDFTKEETGCLAAGLHSDPAEAERRLERVFHWTDGHPFLTQALCRAAEEKLADPASPEAIIDPLVETRFLSSQAQREETNLKYTRARLTVGGKVGRRLLRLYRRVRDGKSVPDEPTSPTFSQLKLSGVVKVSDAGTLAVRNRIYATVFDPAWVKSEMPADRGRQLAAATLAASMIGLLLWYAIFYPRIYIQQIQEATAADAFPIATSAYAELRANPFTRFRANELLAQFWDHRARREMEAERRDESIIAWLKAIETNDTVERRREAQALIDYDYENLRKIFRIPPVGRDSLGLAASVDFSPDSRTILASDLRRVQFWNRAGQPGKSIERRPLPLAARFTSDGTSALIFDDVGGWAVYDIKLGNVTGPIAIGTLRNYPRSLDITVSPDNKLVSSAGRVWDRLSGVEVGLMPTWTNVDSIIAFSRGGDLALARDKKSRLILIEKGRHVRFPTPFYPFKGAFDPEGKRVFIAGTDGAQVWDVGSARAIGPLLRMHTLSVAFGPDDQEVLTGGLGSAQLWSVNPRKPKELPLREGALGSAVASADGRTMVTDDGVGTVRRLRLIDGLLVGVFSYGDGECLGSNGEAVLIVEKNGMARLWNLATNESVSLASHARIVRAVFSRDGSVVATLERGGSAQIWSAKTGLAIDASVKLGEGSYLVAVSSGGRRILWTDSEGEMQIWESKSGELTKTGGLNLGAFSPDGEFFLSEDEAAILLLRSSSGKTVGMLRSVASKRLPWPHDIVFSPDGRLALIFRNEWAHLYSIENGTVRHVASRHLRGAWKGVALFQPDCHLCVRLVLGYSDSYFISTIRFDEPDGKPLKGDPKDLLAKWQDVLSLTFDKDMHIVPRWPIPDPLQEERP